MGASDLTQPRAASFAEKALALAQSYHKFSALPTYPSERGGPPPLLVLSPGLCGPRRSVACGTHRTARPLRHPRVSEKCVVVVYQTLLHLARNAGEMSPGPNRLGYRLSCPFGTSAQTTGTRRSWVIWRAWIAFAVKLLLTIAEVRETHADRNVRLVGACGSRLCGRTDAYPLRA